MSNAPEIHQDRKFWPTADYLELMGWPTEEVEILGAVRRVDYEVPHYRPWDQEAMGRGLRNWAYAYGFTQDTRLDRLQHENGTYVEIGYSMQTVTLRWGRVPAPGRNGGMEGVWHITHGSLRLSDRDFIDATLKELSTRA